MTMEKSDRRKCLKKSPRSCQCHGSHMIPCFFSPDHSKTCRNWKKTNVSCTDNQILEKGLTIIRCTRYFEHALIVWEDISEDNKHGKILRHISIKLNSDLRKYENRPCIKRAIVTPTHSLQTLLHPCKHNCRSRTISSHPSFLPCPL